MASLLTGLVVLNLTCDKNWSRYDNTTLALLSTSDNNICVDFKDLQNKNTKFKNCFDFKENVTEKTIFQHENSTYVFGSSNYDNVTLLVINGRYPLLLFNYKYTSLKYNIFTKTLYNLKDNVLKEYSVTDFISSLINQTELIPLTEILIPLNITDYDFIENNTIYYLSDNKIFIESLFLQNDSCLPFIYRINPCKEAPVTAFKIVSFIFLVPVFVCITCFYRICKKKTLEENVRKSFIERKPFLKQTKKDNKSFILNDGKKGCVLSN